MKQLVAGIVGCGGIANQKHLPALSRLPMVRIAGFCDVVAERAQKACQEYATEGAKVYTDYRELLKDDSIDVIYVLTPNKHHSYIAIAALEAGKHVMCEKPMAKTYMEAKDMVEAAKRTGKLLTVGYQNRQRPDSLFVKELCERGEFGEIYHARANAIRRRGVPTWGVFLNVEEQGGGPLIDIGTHALDLTLWLMDNYKPKAVLGNVYQKLNQQKRPANKFGDWDTERFTVEDSAFGLVLMENGATIVLSASWALNTATPHNIMSCLYGPNAGVEMYDEGTKLNRVTGNRQMVEAPDFTLGGDGHIHRVPDLLPQDREAENFIGAVLGEEKLVVLPEQALVVTQILEGLYRSAETGQPYLF